MLLHEKNCNIVLKLESQTYYHKIPYDTVCTLLIFKLKFLILNLKFNLIKFLKFLPHTVLNFKLDVKY